MRATKTRQFSKGILEREEWFFGKVAKDEIVTCFFYEYARSRNDVRELVQSWRKKLADLDKVSVETGTRAFWSELAKLTDPTWSQLLINLPEFPDLPWQKIRPSQRAKWKRLLTFYRDRYPDGLLGGLWPETKQNTLYAIRYNHMRTSLGELVPFSIDWRGGIGKVISDFEKWARERYSGLDLPKKKKPRDTYYESLKQLGVMRLKDKLRSWNAVQRHTHEALGYKLYGDDQALWRKARLAAIKRIREMFPNPRPHWA